MKSYWARVSLVIGAVVLIGCGAMIASGKVIASPTTERVPDQVRTAPNGYRTFHFWHGPRGGFRGGK